MAIGGLIAIPELQAEGPARLQGQTQGYFQISFLRSGAQMTVEQRQAVRYVLLPETPVVVELDGAELPGVILAAPLRSDRASGLIIYPVRLANGCEEDLGENLILQVPPATDPAAQLLQVEFHELQARFARAGTPRPPEPWGAQTFSAREQVLRWRDEAWAQTGGVVGLAGARVVPLPHQLAAARQVLADRRVRYLLADEVGLGKTIEAGLIMQSLAAMQPTLRVLIVVPGALTSQWFLEMFVKFGGRRFTIFDSERLATHDGNPWQTPLTIVSSRALEELSGIDAIRFAKADYDLLIVDECHRMAPGGVLYKRLAAMSKKVPHLLLLSATPSRHHADAYLALLHLLQPDAYPLDDLPGFRRKWEQADAVGSLLVRTRAGEDMSQLSLAWQEVLGEDPELDRALAACRESNDDRAGREALASFIRERYHLDRRVIRHRREVLRRLGLAGDGGMALATRSYRRLTYTIDDSEQAVRSALRAYAGVLLQRFGEPQAPPRLVHWLLQLQQAVGIHPRVLERLCAMRRAVLEAPEEFADYRQRAAASEVLREVLRTDLSEAEQASHIAISASCHIDPAYEAPALKELLQAVGVWLKRIPVRERALLAALRDFWDEFPQEKVLIFTGHAIGVQAVAAELSARLGAERVETFGAHQDALAREAAASRFKNSDDCWLLVSDALGGEGRNFQFVSLIVHHDLPWSVAMVEQRIGRVDRLGRDADVPSLVLQPDDPSAVDQAWARVLAEAVKVFQASSSGLEFVASAVESRAALAAVGGDGERLLAELPSLSELVEAERQRRDEAEDELHAAGQQAYVRAAELARSLHRGQVPVPALCLWLRGMGGQVRREEEAPRPFLLRGRSGEPAVSGLFDRDSALAHEHLDYFARGHGLIDSLVADAESADWCRAQAWRRRPGPACRNWEGLRLQLELQLDLSGLIAAGLPVTILRRLYAITPPAGVQVCIEVTGERVRDPRVLAHLAAPFDPRAGDSALSAKTSRETWMRPLLENRLQQVVAWQDRVRGALAALPPIRAEEEQHLRQATLKNLRPALAAQLRSAEALATYAARRLGAAHPDASRLAAEFADEQAQHDALLQTVSGARLNLASVVYLVVA